MSPDGDKPELEPVSPPLQRQEDKEHAHEVFPQSWIRRWPILIVIGTAIALLANLGHIFAGIEALERAGERVFGKQDGVPAGPPLRLSLSEQLTRPLDGYSFTSTVSVPKGHDPGQVFPGGVTTQLLLQAPTEVAAVREDLLSFHRVRLLDPILSRDGQLLADAYLGTEFDASSPDIFVMPKDDRSVC